MNTDLVINHYPAITSICDLLEEILPPFELKNERGTVATSIGDNRNVLNGLISSKWEALFQSITILTSDNHPESCRTSACKLIATVRILLLISLYLAPNRNIDLPIAVLQCSL
jgi:hypothetical protein